MCADATNHPRIARKRARQASEVGEDGLRDVLGQVRVAIHESDGRGINQPEVARHQFAEAFFRTGLNVFREQLLAVRHLSTLLKTRTKTKPDNNLSAVTDSSESKRGDGNVEQAGL